MRQQVLEGGVRVPGPLPGAAVRDPARYKQEPGHLRSKVECGWPGWPLDLGGRNEAGRSQQLLLFAQTRFKP